MLPPSIRECPLFTEKVRAVSAAVASGASNVQCSIVSADGSIRPVPGPAGSAALLGDETEFLWVEMLDPSAEQMNAIAAEFELHPLVVEDALDAHLRSKIDAYDDCWLIVAHAVLPSEGEPNTSEIALIAGDRFVVTIRHEPAWPIDEFERRWKTLKALRRDSGAFVYTILDTIVDGYMPFLEAAEMRLESVETRLLADTKGQINATSILSEILQVKHGLQIMRRIAAPMQDVIARISRGDIAMFSEDEMLYFRAVGNHVKRLLARMDSLNEMVTTTLSLSISMASNRQAEVSKQLTIIATIFLPLTFITGFFGQNFGFLVNNITTPADFFVWGIGADVAAICLLFYFFVRRRWL